MPSRPIRVAARLILLVACGTGLAYSSRIAATADRELVLAQADTNQPQASPSGGAGKAAPKPAPKRPAPTPAAPPQAQTQPAQPPAGGAPAPAGGAPQPPAPAPEAPAAPGTNPTGELQPVIHAQNAKITTCMDNILGQSGSVIDSAHTAISTWVTTAPNDNVFQSIVGLSYPNKGAPNAAALIFAAPLGPNKCEGQTVQVYPVAQACSAIQASLIKEGHTIGTLQALPLVETKGGVRDLLLPTAGGGCVIVAVSLR